ncbi:tRNA (adenosine(37)-N6)-dimethylallyltransferase MiaA [Seongchinamella unica]|uniref:tRNA dimethylallyltransferase n=1 Tax=Seongchinamella unica TaxID=2547392 RepID=A0A4R5LQZ1_9GAMM|nr:tRNA (adenosine(37)-N6)-dimethylallyltransferase MiaA [Seongchinamella unica]TDG12915.1 tRNA (adenosine(37)-N6)-dimethylallyltransferase MiaA [Seongchinamella unica]
MASSKPPLICLMGPTASGKTDLAIALAGRLDCELISVDSALVYRGMDIGSAKPDYPHHLVDIRDPAEPYSAADFAADANRLADEITARGRIPLLVGGTMLYFKAFLEPLATMPAADPGLRAAIEAEAEQLGWPAIHARLAEVDPESAARIHPNHSQRLARALEIYRSTGRTLTEWHADSGAGGLDDPHGRFAIAQLAICPRERSVLHQRIALRFEQMMQAGFLEEVRALHRRGDLSPDLPALRAVGYRQLWQYLEGECSLEQAVEQGVAATRQLAKRQLTWLRKWRDLAWIYTDQAGNIEEFVLSNKGGEGASSPSFPRRRESSDPSSRLIGQKPLQAALNYLGYAPM